MTTDLDKLFAMLADDPQGPRSPHHAEILAEAKRRAAARSERPRAIRRGWVLAGGLCILVICLAVSSNVGTEDFKLVLREAGPDGSFHFRGGHTGQGNWANTSMGTMPPDSVQLMNEEMWSRIAGGDYTLVCVTGTTIWGCTKLVPVGRIQTRFGPKLTNVPVKIPFNSPASEACETVAARFVETNLAEVLSAIREGRAERIEPLECMAEGYCVHFERWRFQFPEYGTVVYWDGETCSVGNRNNVPSAPLPD